MLPSDVDQYRVIDTDTHVIEPYDLWTSRLSVAKWGDKVPHVRWDERRQEDAWYFGAERVGAAAEEPVVGADRNLDTGRSKVALFARTEIEAARAIGVGERRHRAIQQAGQL
jgi:hypothetical protein